VIEKLLGFRARLWPAAQSDALCDCLIDHFTLWRCFENRIECGVNCRFINLLHAQIALESLSADGPLLRAQRRIAVRIAGIVKITILTQTFDHLFDCSGGRPAPFEETLSKLRYGTLLGGQQPAGPLKDTLTCLRGIQWRSLFLSGFGSSLPRCRVPLRRSDLTTKRTKEDNHEVSTGSDSVNTTATSTNASKPVT
jgi:hypothetical protein